MGSVINPDPMPAGTFAAARKHSVTIAGHPTSLRIEPVFWDALQQEAADLALPVNALLARIDAARLESKEPPNLASAVRMWLFATALRRAAST